MSWFKRVRNESKSSRKSLDAGSYNSEELPEGRSRRDTDPATCLEVFSNHWQQANEIISKKDGAGGSNYSLDENEAVIQNFEQMITLLANEEGEEGQGMPGPILHLLLEQEILEKFCGWCHQNADGTGKLLKEQLHIFEHLISHSHQLMLIHKPIIRPLLNLLAYCIDGFNLDEIESHLVLVLHQICIQISKQNVILESFFTMNTDHGATKFLIFSLLIPFLHREGTVGQQARDALLLIMTLSSKNPHIGQYIAENSDFCPVLATGLSGLYSDLPRKMEIPAENWYRITDEEVVNIPQMNMFLNSLEFCNAVAQIAHPLVRDQLISFIYNGFLVPVLGPALHQNSREEVITTTAYLELFLRRVSEPSLVKAFLMFILMEKNDEIVILDSLITRINGSSKLSLVSLSLFHTLVDLNCEDVMYELIFKYLIPCSHVMVSQRRSLKDVDLYSKSAEKFLSLRPTCCLPELTESPIYGLDLRCIEPTHTNILPPPGLRNRKERSNSRLIPRDLKPELIKTSFPPGSFGSKLEHFETSYTEYLEDACHTLHQCSLACQSWMYPYDGESPSCFKVETDISEESKEAPDVPNTGSSDLSQPVQKPQSAETVSNLKENEPDKERIKHTLSDQHQVDKPIGDTQKIAIDDETSVSLDSPVEYFQLSRLETMEEFLSMLDDCNGPVGKGTSIEESIFSLESVLSSVSSLTQSRTSTPRREVSHEGGRGLQSFCDSSDISSVCLVDGSFKQPDLDTINRESTVGDPTTFEVIEMSKAENKTAENSTSAFEIVSKFKEPNSETNSKESTSAGEQNGTTFVDISVGDVKPVESIKDIASHQQQENSVECENRTELTNSHEQANVIGDDDEELNHLAAGHQLELDSNKGNKSHQSTKGGDKSVRFAGTTMQNNTEIVVRQTSSSGTVSKSPTGHPSIGAFLTALLSKLDFMMQNSLPVNLVLTGLISRLAAFSQPLLRSFLLNHNLVFQPTVKSLVQVLTSVRQKVDHFSYTVHNFETLLLRARRTLASREGLLPDRGKSLTPSPEFIHSKTRAATAIEVPSKEKRHRTLTELLFRRNPAEKKSSNQSASRGSKLQMIPGQGARYINRRPEVKSAGDGLVESAKTRNAVYCALVIEEFVKELAALAQEHSVLHLHDDSCWSVIS